MFFFFQAEDGIRDSSVTGVQTCALPICLQHAAGDGDLASRMLKASPNLPQTYWVKVKGRLSDTQIKTLAHSLKGEIVPLRAPHSAGKNPPNPWYQVQFSGVRRDLLRRNLLNMGHRVEKMKRVKL